MIERFDAAWIAWSKATGDNFPYAQTFKSYSSYPAFNLFNTPEFGPPNTSVSSSAFGTITSQINNPRQIQVAAKIIF